jgi:hypothetical protein
MFGRIALAGTVIGASAAVGLAVARREWRTWGIDPLEATRALPGDDLVADANAVETRGIDLDAPPEAVWPWLVQMGYGRAGWYSYDAIDVNQSSSRVIAPDMETPAVGDIMPTHPGGGFVIKAIEPTQALVLYVDREIASRQATEHPLESASPNVRATGRFMDAASDGDFAASWSFVLEPTGSGGTRLIERARARMEAPRGAAALLRPILGFGVFVMMRRQLLGIRDRVHAMTRAAEGGAVSTPAAI